MCISNRRKICSKDMILFFVLIGIIFVSKVDVRVGHRYDSMLGMLFCGCICPDIPPPDLG
jgi:hypothetical protein